MNTLINIVAAVLCTFLLLCMSTVAKAECGTNIKSKVLREYKCKKEKKRKRKKKFKPPFIINVYGDGYRYHNRYRYYRGRRYYGGCRGRQGKNW